MVVFFVIPSYLLEAYHNCSESAKHVEPQHEATRENARVLPSEILKCYKHISQHQIRIRSHVECHNLIPLTMTSSSEEHTIPSSSPQTHSIIFLHGRGSSASTFASEIFESQDHLDRFFPDIFPSIKWVFPCAPTSWAESEQESITQWFDMTSVQRPWEDAEMQRKGLDESAKYVAEVFQREVQEVGKENVVVMGISQGCVTGLYALLKYGVRVGGFVGLCGWVPREDLEESVGEIGSVKDMPILLQHCRDDEVVPIRNGEDLAERLREFGMQVEWECFEEGGHWLNEPAGMDGIVRFIARTMGDKKREEPNST